MLIIKMLLKEIKCMWYYLASALIVIIAFFSISLCMLSFSLNGTSQINQIINNLFSEGFKINFFDINDEQETILQNNGITNIIFKLSKEKEILEDSFYINKNNKDQKIELISRIFYFTDKTIDVFGNVIPDTVNLICSGRIWRKLDNNLFNNQYYSIWISDSVSAKYNIGKNDIISFYIPNTDYSIKMVIQGIYKKEEIEKIGYNYDCLIPFDCGKQIANLKNISLNCTAIGTLKNITDYYKLYNIANKQGFGISGIGQVEKLIKGIKIINSICFILSFLLILCAIFVLYNITNMVIKNRTEFITINIMLGNNSFSIALIYIFIMEIIVVFSLVFSYYLGHILNTILVKDLILLFDSKENFTLDISPFTLIIAFLLCNIILAIFALKLLIIIRKISILNLIRKED